jgi:hypothetical protein
MAPKESTKEKKPKAKKKSKAKPGDKRLNNQFWKVRSKSGRDKLFESPEALWIEACKYFKWCEGNPLYEMKVFSYRGGITTTNVPKMRAMTLRGLCLYLGCSEGYFRNFKKHIKEGEEEDKGFMSVIREIEDTIYIQKFEGAAAGLFESNIIARDLGLIDKQEVTGKDGAPLVNQIIKWGDKEVKV